MDSAILIFVFTFIISILNIEAISLEDALNLLVRRSLKENKYDETKRRSFYEEDDDDNLSYRRGFVSVEEPEDYRKSTFYQFDPNDQYKASRRLYDYAGMRLPIIGSPTIPSQLPEAEAILPGHTLIRPALGMLKSAVKFPHKDLNDGAGVYGNIDNLGITYGGTGERVLYTGFRRNNDYSQSIPSELKNFKPRYVIALVRRKPRNKVTYKYNDYDIL